MYLFGQGRKADFTKALRNFNEALKLNKKNSSALYHLGLMHFKGYGININKAIKLFSESAKGVILMQV